MTTSRQFEQDATSGEPAPEKKPSPALPDAAGIGEPRRALLIGNGRYLQGRLANPVRDVRRISKILTSLGFTVTVLEDADKRKLHKAVIDFCSALEEAGPDTVALFYFAGHGIQYQGTNYLLPVDAEMPSTRYLSSGGFPVDEIVNELSRATRKANVIVLDACRDNPLPSMVRQSRDVTQGLATLKLTSDRMLVVFSTAAGALAEDGDGENSPYAEALAECLPGLLEPGRRVHDVFVEAADRVRDATGGRQNPALYLQGSLPPLVVTEKDHERLKKITEPPPPKRPWLSGLTRRQKIGAAALGSLAALFLWLVAGPGERTAQISGGTASTQNDTKDIASALASEFPAMSTPDGYRFQFVEPFCCIEEKEKSAGIEGYARVYFTRDELPQPKPGAAFQAWEGFNYLIFTDASHAGQYAMPDSEQLDLMKLTLGNEEAIAKNFNPKAWQGRVSVQITPYKSAPYLLRCFVADTLISCPVRASNPRVLIELLLQEPKLRQASSAAARQDLVIARVTREEVGLLKAADEHVRWASRQAAG